VPLPTAGEFAEFFGRRPEAGEIASTLAAIEDPQVVLGLPVRQPAPPPVTPVAPIRTAPIPLPPSGTPTGFVGPSVAMPGLSELSIAGPSVDAIRSLRQPPRVEVPPMQRPCPPGFVRR